MSTKAFVAIITGLLVFLVLFLSLYTVPQGYHALELHLGDLVKNKKTGKVDVLAPGLHTKLPFVTSVVKLDTRLQDVDVESSRILTAEQKGVIVDYYVKWKVNDLPLYYKRTGGFAMRAQDLLRQKVNDSLRAEFGERTIQEVISSERQDIMKILLKKANQSAKSLGIQVVDVRIKGIDLPKQVLDSVFARMRAEREQVATKHRAQGQAAAETIRATADAKVAILLAEAKTQSQRIRAQGDAQAADIYRKAYSQEPQFYALYRSLEAYRDVFRNKNSIMVLKPTSQFFRYFNQSQKKAS